MVQSETKKALFSEGAAVRAVKSLVPKETSTTENKEVSGKRIIDMTVKSGNLDFSDRIDACGVSSELHQALEILGFGDKDHYYGCKNVLFKGLSGRGKTTCLTTLCCLISLGKESTPEDKGFHWINEPLAAINTVLDMEVHTSPIFYFVSWMSSIIDKRHSWGIEIKESLAKVMHSYPLLYCPRTASLGVEDLMEESDLYWKENMKCLFRDFRFKYHMPGDLVIFLDNIPQSCTEGTRLYKEIEILSSFPRVVLVGATSSSSLRIPSVFPVGHTVNMSSIKLQDLLKEDPPIVFKTKNDELLTFNQISDRMGKVFSKKEVLKGPFLFRRFNLQSLVQTVDYLVSSVRPIDTSNLSWSSILESQDEL